MLSLSVSLVLSYTCRYKQILICIYCWPRGKFGTTNKRGGTGSYRHSPILTGSTLRQGPSTRRWKHSRVMSSIRHANLSRTVGCGNAKAPTPGSPRRVRQQSGRRSRQKVAHITRTSAVAAALFFRPRTHTICAESFQTVLFWYRGIGQYLLRQYWLKTLDCSKMIVWFSRFQESRTFVSQDRLSQYCPMHL